MSGILESSTVLVIDDDRMLVDTLAHWLEDEGFNVRRAYDGLQGLASVNRESPDLVLADIAMPGIDGLRLAQIMRERGVPIVLVSSSAPSPAVLRGVPFIGKPFDIDDMFRVIVDTLSDPNHPAMNVASA